MRQKEYFNSKELPHIWANRSAIRGRCASEMSFDGDLFKSYSAVIAKRDRIKNGREYYILNTKLYSNTTSRHQNEVQMAIPEEATVFRFKGENPTPKQMVEQCIENAIDAQEHSQRKRVKQVTKDACTLKTQLYLEEAQRICEFFGIRKKIDEKTMARLIRDKAADERAIERARQKRLEDAQKEFLVEQEKEKEDLEKWKNGERISRRFYHSAIVLRKEGQEVVTSAGARVRYSEAKRGFELIAKIRSSPNRTNIPTGGFSIGDYPLKDVTEEEVVIGCHHIAWEEVERFAQQQEWIK